MISGPWMSSRWNTWRLAMSFGTPAPIKASTAPSRSWLQRTGPTVAIAFDVTLERCLAQNAARTERHVPEDVVARHVREMAIALEQLPAEGYADVHIVRDAEMDGA
jgi:hypothetical protein